MRQQTIKDYFRAARPSGIDVAYCAVIALVVLLVALIPTLLTEYDLLGAREQVSSGFGARMSNLLLSIDTLSFTSTVVTFLFWAAVGMLVYGAVNSFIHAAQEADAQRQMASDDFVHPLEFSRANFWRQQLSQMMANIMGVGVLAIFTGVTAFVLLPIATTHIRALFNNAAVVDFLSALASVLLLIAGAVCVVFIFRLWRNRRLLFAH